MSDIFFIYAIIEKKKFDETAKQATQAYEDFCRKSSSEQARLRQLHRQMEEENEKDINHNSKCFWLARYIRDLIQVCRNRKYED